MPTTEERLTALERAVTRLAANKLDITAFNQINNLNISRYTDLFTAYSNLNNDVSAIKTFITNSLTGTYS